MAFFKGAKPLGQGVRAAAAGEVAAVVEDGKMSLLSAVVIAAGVEEAQAETDDGVQPLWLILQRVGLRRVSMAGELHLWMAHLDRHWLAAPEQGPRVAAGLAGVHRRVWSSIR